jgi:hypothetical protein
MNECRVFHSKHHNVPIQSCTAYSLSMYCIYNHDANKLKRKRWVLLHWHIEHTSTKRQRGACLANFGVMCTFALTITSLSEMVESPTMLRSAQQLMLVSLCW